jgi:hypothetical protein
MPSKNDSCQGSQACGEREDGRREKGEEVELNVSGKIIQGDLDAEEWQELSLNSVLAFIHALFA